LSKLAAPRTDAPLSLSVRPQISRPLSTARHLNEMQADLLAFSAYMELHLPPERRPHASVLTAPAEEAGRVAGERLEEVFDFRLGTFDPPG
jgi:hypothetical protein